MDYTKPKRQRHTHHAPPSPPQTPHPLPLPTKLSAFKSWKAARSISTPISTPTKLPLRPPLTTRSVSTPTPIITPIDIGASSREPNPKLKSKPPKRYSSPERECTLDGDVDLKVKTQVKVNAGTSTSPPDRQTPLHEKQATDRAISNRVLREHREAQECIIVSQGAWRLEEDMMSEGFEGQIERLTREVERVGMSMGMSMDQEEAEDDHERSLHREEFKPPPQTGERLSLDFEYAGSGSESESESESEGSEQGSEGTSPPRGDKIEEQASSTKDAEVKAKAQVSPVDLAALEIIPSREEGGSSPDDREEIVEFSVPVSASESGSIDCATLNLDSEIQYPTPTPTIIDLLFPTTPTTPRIPRIPQNKEIWEQDYNPDSDTDTDTEIDTDSDTDTDTDSDEEEEAIPHSQPLEQEEEKNLKDEPLEKEENPPTEIWEHSHPPNPNETTQLCIIFTTSLIFAILSWIWFGLA